MPELLILSAAVVTSLAAVTILTRKHKRTRTIRGMLGGDPPYARRR